MLVEDDPADAGLARLALGKKPTITVAGSMEEVLAAKHRGEVFDVILLDLSLPDSFGFSTVSVTREAYPFTPIVVLTGLDEPSIEAQIVEFGAQDYLVKCGYDSDSLQRAVRHAIVRQQLEARLTKSEAEYRTIFRLAPDAIFVVTDSGSIVSANPAALRMFDEGDETGIVAREITEFLPDLAAVFRNDGCVTEGRSEGSGQRHGATFPVSMATAPLDDGRILVMVQDITERKQWITKLEQLARTDPLTGLANRRVLEESLEVEFKRYKRSGEDFALLMIDIDHFKLVNDKYGHEAGDRALCAMARVFEKTARDTDLAARYGGEEFVFLLAATSPKGAVEMGERIRVAVGNIGIESAAGAFNFTVSIGVSSFDPDDQDWQEPLRRADQGLYAAKSSGRNLVVSVAREPVTSLIQKSV